MARGKFISLEGGEGVGKSTQLRALEQALADRGIDCLTTREPGGSEGAETIRSLLLGGDDSRWSIRTEALLFAAARGDHVEKTIRPALEQGRCVLTDRFLDSSLAYQGGAGGLGLDTVRKLHEIGSSGFLPDRTLVLTLGGEEGAERARKRDGDEADRIGGRSNDFHCAVDRAFQDIATQEPERVHLIDATGSPADVTKRLLAALEDLFE